MTWLVTGGAGYIGAHVVAALQRVGLDPVVVDDLSTGFATRLAKETPFIELDVCDPSALARVFASQRLTGVIHLAARKDVAESTVHPLCYYRDNIDGLRNVLTLSARHGVEQVVYSSSAAVYGTPQHSPVTEDSRTEPCNAYGRTKLIGEWMLRDAAASGRLRYAALRYFNVAGAGRPELGDIGGTNLVPRLLEAFNTGEPATIFGEDYPTPDGTAVRDYIHVEDLADAHVRAAQALAGGTMQAETLNVGRGVGVSVLEMIHAIGAAWGQPVPYVKAPRRVGDPASVIAAAERIAAVLGWRARHNLKAIATSAVEAQTALTPV